MNTTFRKLSILFLIAGFAAGVSSCKTMHGVGEDTEKLGNKIQKEADQHTENDDNNDNREHDQR